MTLEDQMICGALQTLNEEACEDVLEETVGPFQETESEVPITFVVPPSPDRLPGEYNNFFHKVEVVNPVSILVQPAQSALQQKEYSQSQSKPGSDNLIDLVKNIDDDDGLNKNDYVEPMITILEPQSINSASASGMEENRFPDKNPHDMV